MKEISELESYLESFEHTGIYIIDRKTMEVYYENATALKYTGRNRVGEPCYLVHGNVSMCASCPLRKPDKKTLVNRADLGMVFAVTSRETKWKGKDCYTIHVEKERELPKHTTLSAESLERMNRALHSSIISYVDVNMATCMCQAIHFSEEGDHQIFDMPYEEYVQDICMKRYVHEEDRIRGEAVLGLHRLKEISSDSEGSTEESVRFRILDAAGAEHTLESTAYYLRDELPHHVSIIARNMDRSMIGENLINQLISNDYDYLAIFDVVNHTNQVIANTGRYNQKEMENFLKQENREAYLRSIYVGKDVETFVYHNSLSYIRGQIEQQSSFDNYYYIKERNGDVSYKKETLSYLNGDRRYLLLSRADSSDAVRSQQEINRELRTALEKARKATEERTELFARMSHDLRTPMNGILGMTALSAQEQDVQVLRKNLAQIDNSARYMLRMINDTLDMKRIETGNLVLKPRYTYLQEFMDSLNEMMKPNVQTMGLSYQVVNKNIDLNRYGNFDPVRMMQIFTCILSNAIKYTPKDGSIVFTMECLKHENNRDDTMFEVRDTGIGMSQEFLNTQLFLPYAQENNHLTGRYAGPGLGLAITKSLVDLMGGRITIESEPGDGTCVRIYLSIEVVDAKEYEQSQAKIMEKNTSTMQRLKNRRILLCEDHPLNAEIAKRLLEKVGCQVTWAKDGEEGLEFYEDAMPYTFDVVLMDIRMPRMDGIQTARAIRNAGKEDAKTLPIIALTANAFDSDKSDSKEAGMNDHLAKPVVPQVLYETIAKYI